MSRSTSPGGHPYAWFFGSMIVSLIIGYIVLDILVRPVGITAMAYSSLFALIGTIAGIPLGLWSQHRALAKFYADEKVTDE